MPSTDPAQRYWNQGRHSHELHHRPFTHMPPPRNPALVAKANGTHRANQATGMTLFPDNLCPAGHHCGKTMRQVPKADLLIYWTHRQALQKWPEWARIIDYIYRHPEVLAD